MVDPALAHDKVLPIHFLLTKAAQQEIADQPSGSTAFRRFRKTFDARVGPAPGEHVHGDIYARQCGSLLPNVFLYQMHTSASGVTVIVVGAMDARRLPRSRQHVAARIAASIQTAGAAATIMGAL